ncbi:MAG: hypothetical protein ACWGPN_13805 [Gammaproteobacteria bacterium]
MSDQTLMYWGMVVTMFLLIAAMITARDVFEAYLEKRRTGVSEEHVEPPRPPRNAIRPPE